jgi:hypothetical protein
MTSTLRAFGLATLAATLLCFASLQGAFAEGRGAWDGYAWRQIALADCAPSGTVLHCPPHHEKWDWKRNQWVDIVVELDMARGTLHLRQRLTNNDRRDSDYVCVTALAVSAAGNTLVAHHQNWHMDPGAVVEESFAYGSSRLDQVATIQIGSKQCRGGAGQDDALYAHVLAGIQS